MAKPAKDEDYVSEEEARDGEPVNPYLGIGPLTEGEVSAVERPRTRPVATNEQTALDIVSEITQGNIARGAGRPVKGYYLADRTRVPAATTLAAWAGDKNGLINWAKRVWYDGGAAGIPFDAVYTPEADIGTLVHSKIEAEIHGLAHPKIAAEFRKPVNAAYEAWADWMLNSQIQVVATELPLVSEQYRFGGTLDAVLRDRRGRLAIGDWKSSKAVYGEFLRQVAAYGILWNEHHPEETISGGFHVVRFSKEHGDLEHRHFPELDDARRLFLMLREAYDLAQQVDKRAK